MGYYTVVYYAFIYNIYPHRIAKLVQKTSNGLVLSYQTTLSIVEGHLNINPIALRKAKIVYNFGLSKCKRVIL